MAAPPPAYNPNFPPPENSPAPGGYVAQQQPIPDIQYAPQPSASRPYQGYPAPTYPVAAAPPPVIAAAPVTQAPPIINVVQTQQTSQATAVA